VSISCVLVAEVVDKSGFFLAATSSNLFVDELLFSTIGLLVLKIFIDFIAISMNFDFFINCTLLSRGEDSLERLRASFVDFIHDDLALEVLELTGITDVSLLFWRFIDVLKVALEFSLRYLLQSGFIGRWWFCAFYRMYSWFECVLTWRHSIDEVEVQGAFSIVVRILEVLMDELVARGLRITRFVFVWRLCLDFLFALHVWVDGLRLGRLLYLEATGQALPHLLSDFLNLNLRSTI